MRQILPSEPNRMSRENMLRTTLQEHAPIITDSEQRWLMLAAQLPSFTLKTPVIREYNHQVPDWLKQSSTRRWKSIPVVAAITVLSILLLGAGVTGGLYFWGGAFGDQGLRVIGDQHLYTTIGQKQEADQVTVTITKAYADTGRTLIAYDLQIPASLAQHARTLLVGSYSLVDSYGEEPQGGDIQCTAFQQNGSPVHCLMTLPSFHPTTGASHVTIIWNITAIYIWFSQSTHNDVLSGPWHFQFTLPFTQVNHGSGGPYAQPTSHP